MGVGFQIKDGGGTGAESDVHTRNGDSGLVAFTDDLKIRDTLFIPAFSATLGVNMAVDASFGGTPVRAHDGTDTALWTGSQILGTKTTFDSTDQADVGTKSVKTANASLGDVYEFDRGSDVTVASFTALSIRIFVDSNWSMSDEVVVFPFDTGTGLAVGDQIALSDLFNAQDFGIWQSIIIPFDSFSFTAATFDALRFEQTEKSGPAPTYYLDEIIVQETGGSAIFIIEPPKETKVFVDSISLSYVDNISVTLLNNSMPNLSFNKILSLTELTNGIVFRNIQNETVIFSSTIRTIGDSLKFGGKLENVISDDTNTCITIDVPFGGPTILDSRSQDRIEVVIQDDLSGLISFTVNTKTRRQFLNTDE